ncbi:hypothetical protein M2149_000814 [Lachnospiraceae bacterium PFB1-21]
MDILNHIPTGRENAVSRGYLSAVTGLSDRNIRQLIHDARRRIPIINAQEGEGYYIPDMNTEDGKNELLRWYRQERSRLKSIGYATTAARRTLKNCGVSVDG